MSGTQVTGLVLKSRRKVEHKILQLFVLPRGKNIPESYFLCIKFGPTALSTASIMVPLSLFLYFHFIKWKGITHIHAHTHMHVCVYINIIHSFNTYFKEQYETYEPKQMSCSLMKHLLSTCYVSDTLLGDVMSKIK